MNKNKIVALMAGALMVTVSPAMANTENDTSSERNQRTESINNKNDRTSDRIDESARGQFRNAPPEEQDKTKSDQYRFSDSDTNTSSGSPDTNSAAKTRDRMK